MGMRWGECIVRVGGIEGLEEGLDGGVMYVVGFGVNGMGVGVI